MGSTQQILHKRINKRIRIGALVLSPFIIIGVASIAFQLSTARSGEYGLFDFSIGKLWSWATSSQNDEGKTSFTPLVIPDIYRHVESRTAVSPSITQEIFKTNPREVHTVHNNTALAQSINVPGFRAIDVNSIKQVNSLGILRSSRFLDPAMKEFLISPDIQIKKSRWAVGASFAPSLTYRTFDYTNLSSVARIDNSTAYTYGQSKEYRKRNDKAIMNFYSGVDLYAHVNDRWTVQAGFYYTSFGERIQVIKSTKDQNNQAVHASEGSPFAKYQGLFDSPEMVEYDEDQKIPFSNYYGLMEVPVLLSYQAINITNQLSLNAQAGFSYAYMDHADLVLYDYETNKYYWINRANFDLLNRHFISVIAGVSLSQYISEEIEIFANPQFKCALNSTFKNSYEVSQHQWATGLRLGMKVHL